MEKCGKCEKDVDTSAGNKYIEQLFGFYHVECFVCPHCNEKIETLPRFLAMWSKEDPAPWSKVCCKTCYVAGRHKKVNDVVQGQDDSQPAWKTQSAAATAPAAAPSAASAAAIKESAAPAAAKFCGECGAKSTGAKFCGECGAKAN